MRSDDAAVAALKVRCSVAGRSRKRICGWTNQPRSSISSLIVKTSHEPSVTSESSVESGGAATDRPGMPSTALARSSVAVRASWASDV